MPPSLELALPLTQFPVFPCEVKVSLPSCYSQALHPLISMEFSEGTCREGQKFLSLTASVQTTDPSPYYTFFLTTPRGMWDILQLGIEPVPLWLKGGVNPWTSREVSPHFLI